MEQRYIRPLLFVALCVLILACSFSTGLGSALTETSVVQRFGNFLASSPFSAFLLALAGLPACIVFMGFSGQAAATVLVSMLGLLPGVLASTLVFFAALAFAFAASRFLLRGALRDWLAGHGSSRLAVFGASAETCLCVLLVSLILGFIPLVLIGFVLGLTRLRSKALVSGAAPLLLLRAGYFGLATVHAETVDLVLFGLLGTAVMVFLAGMASVLIGECQHREAMEVAPARKIRRRVKEPDPVDIDTHNVMVDLDRVETLPDPGEELELPEPLPGTVVLLLEDGTCSDADVAALAAREAAQLGVRVLSLSLHPSAGMASGSIGAETVAGDRVSDLEEAFLKAFRGGADYVVAFRVVTPLLRSPLMQRAIHALSRATVVLGSTDDGYYMVGLRRKGIEGQGSLRQYEPGLLRGRSFDGNLAFDLAGLCRHPEKMPFLPSYASLPKPLVTVIIPAKNSEDTIVETVTSADDGAFAECLVADGGSSDETVSLATSAGAEVLSEPGALAVRLNAAARSARGGILVFLSPGSLLPKDYVTGVWETLGMAGCHLGAFSMPMGIPLGRRIRVWAGTALKFMGTQGLGMAQGLFVRKEDFTECGGFAEELMDEKAERDLIARFQKKGRVILHNTRIGRVSGSEEAADVNGDEKSEGCMCGLVRQIREKAGKYLGKRDGASPGQDRRTSILVQIRDSLGRCDHCGECTRVCPVLKRYRIDISGLKEKPLLAWHCFLCGQCTRVCPQGIDGASVARLLRSYYIDEHKGRMSRPGHSRTIWASRIMPLNVRFARSGENVLLDPEFCMLYPKTAVEVARRMLGKGMGLIVADTGARLQELGMDEEAEKLFARLSGIMEKSGIRSLVTISPSTDRYIRKRGVKTRSVYGVLGREERLVPLDAASHALFVPCMARENTEGDGLEKFWQGTPHRLDNILCCGAGGEASVLEPEIAARMKQTVRECGLPVVTTCTECIEALSRAGCETDHALVLLLGTGEKPTLGVGKVPSYLRFTVGMNGLARQTASGIEGKAGVVRAMAGEAPLGDRKDGMFPAPAGGKSSSVDNTAAGTGQHNQG